MITYLTSTKRYRGNKVLLFTLVFYSLVFSCKRNEQLIKEKDITQVNQLFSLVSPEYSQVDFKNILPESAQMNRFIYEYYYNGGGVALGDFNNDGLEDIYFTSNLKDNKLYLNKGKITFDDITKASGTSGKKGWTTGVTVIDINQDGLLDIYVCKSGRFTNADMRRNELFLNQGVNKNGIPFFVERAFEYGLDDPSFSTQALFFDYDKDGDLDMFLGNHHIEAPPVANINDIISIRKLKSNYGANKLFKNNNGKYEDVTIKSGILNSQMNYALGISSGDINNDGWPDLYVANDYSEPDHVYINNLDGTFKEVAQKVLKQMPNFSMGTDIADINNDGYMDILSLDMVASDNYGIKTSMSGMRPDLFNDYAKNGLHHQYMYNALQLNNGIDKDRLPKFSNISQISGVSSTNWSWAPLIADFDNDGNQDIYITNGIKRDFRNNDFNNFLSKATQDVIKNKKNPLPYYAEWTKYSPQQHQINYLFKNNGDLTFSNISTDNGITQPSFSNGAVYGDLDNDGDLDLVVNNVDEYAFIYENESDKNQNNNFLKIKLNGSKKNQNSIGAKIALHYNNQKQHRELYSTRGYQSAVSNTIHFGLGAIKNIDTIVVEWPDGKILELSNSSVNKTIELSYKDAYLKNFKPPISNKLFKDITETSGVHFNHVENVFNDFSREILLPHKMSQMGPSLAVGDINNDGFDDFYIGGGKGQAARIYFQNKESKFTISKQDALDSDKNYEDTSAILFDADNDNDLDLCITSGSNEGNLKDEHYKIRFYENVNGQYRKLYNVLPKINISSTTIKYSDFDNDGDLDLFIGGRQVPGKYPLPANSYLLRNISDTNGTIKFEDITDNVSPILKKIGMVTSAVWKNIDKDEQPELILCGEWMPITLLKLVNGKYENWSDKFGLINTEGWWNSIEVSDIDKDGDLDIIAGNLGLNYKYKATLESPFEIYAHDFDESGTLDIVLGYHNNLKLYPLRGRECSSQQMPNIKSKFPSYHSFGSATLEDVYTPLKLSKALHYKSKTFANTYFENINNKKFKAHILNNKAQLSSVNTITIEDFNNDGILDLLLAGNLYGAEVETPRNDASYGNILIGNENNKFDAMLPHESKLFIDNEIRNMRIIRLASGEKSILIARNNKKLKILSIKSVN